MKFTVAILLFFSFLSPVFSAPTETKCALQKSLDDFLELPKEISYFKDGAQIYIVDLEGDKVSCNETTAQEVRSLLCGKADDGLYLISKGAEAVLFDAKSFAPLGAYRCQ
jgi:hypothetical protein